MKDDPLSELLKQANIKTENQLVVLSYSIWKYCPDTGRITGAYIICYQGGPIYHSTHDPVPVSQSVPESEYNEACTAGMALAHFRMLIHEFLNKDIDIVPEEAPLFILDRNSDVCMSKNGKDTNHTMHIARRVNFVRNGEKSKLCKLDWCKGGLQLADIANNNVGENNVNPIMKYTKERVDN